MRNGLWCLPTCPTRSTYVLFVDLKIWNRRSQHLKNISISKNITCVFQRIHTGLCDPIVIGDKFKWWGKSQKYQIWEFWKLFLERLSFLLNLIRIFFEGMHIPWSQSLLLFGTTFPGEAEIEMYSLISFHLISQTISHSHSAFNLPHLMHKHTVRVRLMGLHSHLKYECVHLRCSPMLCASACLTERSRGPIGKEAQRRPQDFWSF